MRFIAKLFYIVLIFTNIGLQSSATKSTPNYLSTIARPNNNSVIKKSIIMETALKKPAIDDQEHLSIDDLIELSKQFKTQFEKNYPQKAGTVSDRAFFAIIADKYKSLGSSGPKNLQDPNVKKLVLLGLNYFASKLGLPKARWFEEPVAKQSEHIEQYGASLAPTAPLYDKDTDTCDYIDPYPDNLFNIETYLKSKNITYNFLISNNFENKANLYYRLNVGSAPESYIIGDARCIDLDESKSLENPNLLGGKQSYQQIIKGLERNNRQRDDLKATLKLNNDYQNVAVVEYLYQYLGNNYESLVADDLKTKVHFIKTMLLSDW